MIPLDRLLSWGLARAAVCMTAVAMAGSGVITALIALLLGQQGELLRTTVGIGLVVPLLVGLPLSLRMLRLIHAMNALRHEADRLASTDLLTGTMSRRHFLAVAERDCQRAAHDGEPVSVLLWDVDNFKQVNDRHGHLVGDLVLQVVAQAGARVLRPTDALARWGGEEFVALLPGVPAEEAMRVAWRVRDAICAAHVPVEGLGAVHGRASFRVTASIGVATQCSADLSLTQLIAAADRAMYRAKGAGKDRAVAANNARFARFSGTSSGG